MLGGFLPFILFSVPGMLLAMWAQSRLKSNFNKYSKVNTKRNVTGEQVARELLDAYGLHDVAVEHVAGNLTDHYDPRSKTLRLSDATFASTSVAAAGVAAHEMGHALQDAENYGPLKLRGGMVPAVNFGSRMGPMLVMGGFLLANFVGNFGMYVAIAGLILFSGAALFSLITLPVEFDASKRAKKLLHAEQIMDPQEIQGVDKVLDAAALTYVAAAAAAIGQLLYYAFLIFGRRR